MNDIFDMGTVVAWVVTASEWMFQQATDPWTWLQLVIFVALYIVANGAERAIRPRTERWLEQASLRPRFASLVQAIPSLQKPMAFLLILWLVIGVMQRVTWPGHSYLLVVAASLLTAWVVIRLGSTFIRNPVIAKTLALGAWSIAALNITGLLEPTVQVLDSIAVTLGDLRISSLTVVKGIITLALLLWGAIGLGIGFGLQKVVSNLISGVILLLDKSIKPGDVIELGETFGWITSLGARYVSVVTRDGKEYLIPNEDLITQRVVNWSFSDRLVRLEIPIG